MSFTIEWLKLAWASYRDSTGVAQYRPIGPENEEKKHTVGTNKTTTASTGVNASSRWKWMALILACSNAGILAIMAVFIQSQCSRMACLRRTSVYSPALDGIHYEDVTLHNRFNEPSIYRGPPTQELEDSWHKLYRFGLMAIPDSEMYRLNKTTQADLTRYERVPDSLGGGYRAMPDVLHQLHCLNTVRQYTWLIADGPPHYGHGSLHGLTIPHSLRSDAVGNRMHVDHCIETIRKVLMCHADVTPLLDMVVENDGHDGTTDPTHPPPRQGEFNVFTRCRNFNHLQEWLRDHMVLEFAERTDDSP